MPDTTEPDENMSVRSALGEAMMEFVKKIGEKYFLGGDDVMRQVATEKYRQAVMHAEEQGVESSLTWHIPQRYFV
jgi:hypothetical protein